MLMYYDNVLKMLNLRSVKTINNKKTQKMKIPLYAYSVHNYGCLAVSKLIYNT